MGFRLPEDKRAGLVHAVKELVREVYNGHFDFPYRFRFSVLVMEKLQQGYTAVSTAFSAAEGVTLEKYIIDYRIGRVKEFLHHTNETLADISFKLGFSSVAHLSRQFKEQTGLTPSRFKETAEQKEPAKDNYIQFS